MIKGCWTVLAVVLFASGATSWAQREKPRPGGRPQQGNLLLGQDAPDFNLKTLNGDKQFRLSSNFGKRPTVLIFGSYT